MSAQADSGEIPTEAEVEPSSHLLRFEMALHYSFSDDYEELPYPQEYDYLWTEERYSKFDGNGAGVLSPSWWFRQEAAEDRQGLTSVNPLLVAVVVGVTFSALLLLAPLINPLPRPKLQNDPMCGLTTGGQVLKLLLGNQCIINFVFFRLSAGGSVKSYHALCFRAKLSSTQSA